MRRSNIQPEESRRCDHTLVMYTFEKGTCCSHCSRFMKGLFYQGYKCVRCGISTHRECISQLRRCGTVQPPELPPRPPLLPIVNPLTAGMLPDSPTPFLTKVCRAENKKCYVYLIKSALVYNAVISKLFRVPQHCPRRWKGTGERSSQLGDLLQVLRRRRCH